MSLHKYEVGKLYNANRTRWPQGADYNLRKGEHEFRLFLPDVEKRDIENIQSGQMEFALRVEGPVIFLLYKFGSMGWSDAAYSWHLTKAHLPDEADLPPDLLTPESRALLTVLLIEANTGLLRAIRAVTFSPEFSRALHNAIKAQALADWPGDAAYAQAIHAIYRRYPDSAAMVSGAQSRCIGGV